MSGVYHARQGEAFQRVFSPASFRGDASFLTVRRLEESPGIQGGRIGVKQRPSSRGPNVRPHGDLTTACTLRRCWSHPWGPGRDLGAAPAPATAYSCAGQAPRPHLPRSLELWSDPVRVETARRRVRAGQGQKLPAAASGGAGPTPPGCGCAETHPAPGDSEWGGAGGPAGRALARRSPPEG